MHANLAPEERMDARTREAAEALFEEPDVEAVLVPLVPEGAGVLARAARRYMRAWDSRFIHPQTFFAPGARVLTRAPLRGHRGADAAPFLARALDGGRRVEALPGGVVLSPVGHDLDAWLRWAREEGVEWGRLAALEPRFAAFLPVLGWRAWGRHNLGHLDRRLIEAMEAVRRADPLAVLLHLTREAAWTGGCARGFRVARAARGGSARSRLL